MTDLAALLRLCCERGWAASVTVRSDGTYDGCVWQGLRQRRCKADDPTAALVGAMRKFGALVDTPSEAEVAERVRKWRTEQKARTVLSRGGEYPRERATAPPDEALEERDGRAGSA